MITADQIFRTKLILNLSHLEQEHDENVRIAYEWLDAQAITKAPMGKRDNILRLIDDWGGRKISQTDIDIAVYLHPDTKGDYPTYNIDSRLTLPSAERLRGIGESFRNRIEEQYMLVNYRFYEIVKYSVDTERSVNRSFYREKLPEPQYDPQEFCTQHDNCQCYYCVDGR